MNLSQKNKRLYKELEKLDTKLEQIENASTKRIIRGFKRDLVDIRDMLDRIYKEYEKDGTFDFGRFRKLKDLNMLDDYVAALVINRYISVEKETQATLRRITSTTFDTMKSLEEVAGIQKAFNVEKIVNNKMAGVKWTKRYGVNRSQAIKDIQTTIKSGLKAGDTYTTMSKKLGEKIAGEAYQVDRVIRTEAHRCMNEAKLETFLEINKEYPIHKRWVSASDERTREAHHALEGTTIPVEDNFESINGGQGMAPGQMGLPEDDINCRCWMTLELVREK